MINRKLTKSLALAAGTLLAIESQAALINLDIDGGRIYQSARPGLIGDVYTDLQFNISFDTDEETVTSLSFSSEGAGLSAYMSTSEPQPYDLKLYEEESILFEKLWGIGFNAPLMVQSEQGISEGYLSSDGFYDFFGDEDSVWYERFNYHDGWPFALSFGDDIYYDVYPSGENTVTIAEVPEPYTFALLGLGLLGIGLKRRNF